MVTKSKPSASKSSKSSTKKAKSAKTVAGRMSISEAHVAVRKATTIYVGTVLTGGTGYFYVETSKAAVIRLLDHVGSTAKGRTAKLNITVENNEFYIW